MIDPELQIEIDGHPVKLAELVEMYRGLRWRKWPEEKPEEETHNIVRCGSLGITRVCLLTKNPVSNRFIWMQEPMTITCCMDGDLWLPLSALPKPQANVTKAEGEK